MKTDQAKILTLKILEIVHLIILNLIELFFMGLILERLIVNTFQKNYKGGRVYEGIKFI